MKNNKLIVKPKRPKGEDGYKVFSIRVKEETNDKLEDIAEKTGMSRNKIVNIFLEYALENCRIEE